MFSYLVRRVLMLVPVFLAVSVVIFSILHFIPGDPIDNLLKPGSSPTARAEMEVRYGLDRPLPVQYGIWLSKVVQGDLGTAIVARRPVADLIAQSLPHSLRLGGLALLFSTAVGVGLGITAALLGWIGPIEAAIIHLGPDVLVFLNSVKLLRVRIDGLQ